MGARFSVRSTQHVQAPQKPRSSFSARESATYSRDLLQALATMAAEHEQHRLAQLLSEAHSEADRLATKSESRSRK
jgi:hypothetical protein